MSNRVHLLHGFNVRDSGDATVNKLAPRLEAAGYEIIKHDWGWRGLFGVHFFNHRLVSKLLAQIRDGDHIIAHSDGCNIAMQAAEYGGRIGRMVFVNPALDADQPLPEQIELCLVLHDPGDWWVRIAAWIPGSKWGKQGATGPTYPDRRYIAIKHGYGHSGFFKVKSRVRVLAGHCRRLFKLDLNHIYRPKL